MLVQSLLKKLTDTLKFLIIACIIVIALPRTTKADFNFGAYQSNNIWDELRQTFKLSKNYDRPEVRSQIKWFLNHQDYLRLYAENSEPYLYYVMQQVKKRNMPGEIALLPMIESAYDPMANNSGSGAAGLWQLMSRTGSGLGLKQSWWFDGRRDISNSTNAALNYLQYLNTFFNGNWELTIAAYDSGEGTVQHAVHRNGSKINNANFWSLRLPQETQKYIPKLLALATIITHSSDYHVKLPYIPNQPYFTKVQVKSQIDLPHAAKLAGMSYTDLIKLNPGYSRKATATKAKTLLLPVNKADSFKNKINVAKNATNNNAISTAVSTQVSNNYVVKSGDSMARIAKQHHMKLADLAKLNHLRSNRLKIGQVLHISAQQPVMIANAQKDQIKVAQAKNPSPKPTYYQIRSGDSLSKIAQKYHVKVKNLAQWNKGINARRLKKGQKIIVNIA